MASELAGERVVLGLEVRVEPGVRLRIGELHELLEVGRAGDEIVPERDLLAQALGGAEQLLCGGLIVPQVGTAGGGVELGELLFPSG
jgi:hypothetical protein